MGLSPERSALVDDWLAKNAGTDAPLVKAILTAGELSTGDPKAASPKGARGLMQLTPVALKDIGIDPATFDYDSPSASLRAGTMYVRKLREGYGLTNPLHIAAGFNAGPGAVKKAIAAGTFKALPEETQAYVRRIQAALPPPGASPEAPPTIGAPAEADAAPGQPGAPTALSPAHQRRLARQADVVVPDAAPEGAGAPPAERPSYAAQFASGIPEGAAGIVDLPGAVSGLVGGPAIPQPGGPAVAPYVAAEPQTFPERLVRSAGRGVGATLALAPAIFYSGATIPAVATSLAYGAASGVTAETARTGVEAVGGGPVAQLGAELVGGALAPGSVAAGRFAKGVYGARLAAKDAVVASKTALAVAKEAAKSEAIATSAPVADAKTIAQGAEALAVQQEAATAHAIDSLLVHQDPADRAKMVTAVIQHRNDAGLANISESYTAFTKAMDQRGVAIDLPDLRLTAKEIIRDATDIGLSSDQAQNAAERIIELTQPRAGMLLDASGRPQPVTITRNKASVEQMIALRSELGAIYGRATRGAVKHRAGQLFRSVEQAMKDGLPKDALKTWKALNADRRLHGEIFEAKVVEKALGDTDAGRATAGSLVAKYMEKPWNRDDAIEVGQLLRATGTNTLGHDVLKDGFLRRAIEKVTHTQTGQIDYGLLARQLTNREGLAPVFQSLVTDPRERALFLRTVQEAARGRQWAAAAEQHIGTETARAGVLAERNVTAAERAAQAAEAAAPPRGALTSFPVTVLDLALAGGAFHLGGARAVAIGGTLRTGATLLAWLRQPQNQAFVKKASRTVADSTTGRRMLQGLGAGAAMRESPMLPAFASGPQPVAADQVQSTP